jgi:hypothetical protein
MRELLTDPILNAPRPKPYSAADVGELFPRFKPNACVI